MKQQQSGFSLIELVVGLGIGAIVMTTIVMTITTLLLNYKEPTSREILLQQAHNAGYQMTRDINMSDNVTLGDPNGFPFIVNIPVDQDENNDYHVEYLLDGDQLKRQQFDSLDNLTAENTIAQYVDTGNTTFESPSDGSYKFTVEVSLDEETVSVNYEMKQRLALGD
ncbi:prepilin-type N-terminal cleavage/methylation domain-containing protein [Chloroflexota bacterium]